MLEDWLGPAFFGAAVDTLRLDAALLILGPTFPASATHVWGQQHHIVRHVRFCCCVVTWCIAHSSTLHCFEYNIFCTAVFVYNHIICLLMILLAPQ